MKRVKKSIYAGCVCETLVYSMPERADIRKYKKRVRFHTLEQYEKFKDNIGRKKNAQLINANHGPDSFKGTLTFDDAHEVHDFVSAKKVMQIYIRRLRRKNKDAKIYMVTGRGKTTFRIHFHFIISGLTEEEITGTWTWGSIKECEHLRKNCSYNGVDHGQDYTGLANYYWGHWTEEVGGHHYYASRNHVKPQAEEPTEIKREYTEEKPPRAPKGYVLVEKKSTSFGYVYFKYILDPKIQRQREKERRKTQERGGT